MGGVKYVYEMLPMIDSPIYKYIINNILQDTLTGGFISAPAPLGGALGSRQIQTRKGVSSIGGRRES